MGRGGRRSKTPDAVRRCPDDVARADFLDRTTLALHKTRPVTISACPSGWICHAARAPGSNVTEPAAPRPAPFALWNAPTLTVPVNQSAGPFIAGRDPFLSTCTDFLLNRKRTTTCQTIHPRHDAARAPVGAGTSSSPSCTQMVAAAFLEPPSHHIRRLQEGLQ